MAIIAMTREMGSRGRDVALVLAGRLGLEVFHHELVERDLARRMHLLYGGFTEGFGTRALKGAQALLDELG